MTAEQRERAFDRFWRAPDPTTDGTGLGLAIVAQLTRASGGTAPGHGLDAIIGLEAAPRVATRDMPGEARSDRTPRLHAAAHR